VDVPWTPSRPRGAAQGRSGPACGAAWRGRAGRVIRWWSGGASPAARASVPWARPGADALFGARGPPASRAAGRAGDLADGRPSPRAARHAQTGTGPDARLPPAAGPPWGGRPRPFRAAAPWQPYGMSRL